MKKSNKKQEAITLIALVITIIIIMILAGISINLVLGENGIVKKAKESIKLQKIAQIQEKLELNKVELEMETLSNSTLEKFLDKILDKDIIKELDIEETGQENSKYITVEEEYIFLIEEEENKNIKIEYLGKATEMAPRIINIKSTISGYSINVELETVYNKNGEYKYFIKESTSNEYIEKETSERNVYTFEELKPNIEYDIKVIIINTNNLKDYKDLKVTTNKGNVDYYIDDETIKTQEFSYGESVLNPSFTLEKEDYIFVGWKEENSESAQVLTTKIMENKPIILYAVWEPEAYTITYNIGVGTMPTNTIIEYKKTSETFELPIPTGTNYVFAGWYDNQEYTGDAITKIEKGTEGNKIFYAKEHQHTGTSGQSYANGCYTTAVQNGGSCGGHSWKTVQWHCGACGTEISSNGAACSNRACSHYGSGGSGDWAETTGSGTKYCSSSSGCSKWTWKYIYTLGCGW